MKRVLSIILISICLILFSCKKDKNKADENPSNLLVGHKYRAYAFTSSSGAGKFYYVLEFKSQTEVYDNYRLIDNSNVTDKNLLKWEKTGNTGTSINIYFSSKISKATVTPGIISVDAIGGVRVYEEY